MRIFPAFFVSALALCGSATASMESAQNPSTRLIISVADQQMAVVSNGEVIKRYPISTSRFGLGDTHGSYKTPLGRLRIIQRIGEGLPEGTVFKRRVPTGEILPPNAKGRDPIVTRILWLDGEDAGNANARNRGIYIHGTPQEKQIGRPVSYGCVRMRSSDIVELFPLSKVGTPVEIIRGPLPRLPGSGKRDWLFGNLATALFRSS